MPAKTRTPATCGAVLDLTDAPFDSADGTTHTTATCALPPHDDTTSHEAYLDGTEQTITVRMPPTHTWSKPIEYEPCTTCGQPVPVTPADD